MSVLLWGFLALTVVVVVTASWEPLSALLESRCADENSVFGTDSPRDGRDHLVVMVHGLYGNRSDWTVIFRRLRQRLADRGVLLHASKCNELERTLSGIDSCGHRLEKEIRGIIERCPSLRRISFLSHSMGGLISRYVVGVNFDPASRTVFGLEPCHFVTIATPNLGCGSEHEAKVPLLGWAESVPLLGIALGAALRAFGCPLAALLFKSTGRQLFLSDGSGDVKPLVVRMVEDIPSEGYFYSGLAQFKTRALYANSCGDALVSWANASLRRDCELPWELWESHDGKGVFQEDKLHASTWRGVKDEKGEGKGRGGLSLRGADSASFNGYMLDRLRSLPWLRVDVTFRGVGVPVLAHTHIMVARKWIDSVGLSVVEHICETLRSLDNLSTNRLGSALQTEDISVTRDGELTEIQKRTQPDVVVSK